MSLPEPEPGLVVSFDYLWLHEHQKGREEGRKTRPCVIVLSAIQASNGRKRVTVVPVTHTLPDPDSASIELPIRVKQQLGLDEDRSWIILDEVNQFDWPGFDLRTVPGKPGQYDYGHIPPKLFDRIRQRIGDLARQRKIGLVRRD